MKASLRDPESLKEAFTDFSRNLHASRQSAKASLPTLTVSKEAFMDFGRGGRWVGWVVSGK
ncbi:hypothetical protein CFP71_39395 [Amycolatopsis thailandensis]|uniref:Uncharacterized protein n=1 Tax=Amycolatopsis thailandensis TaxID=589330 RepID=A0A229REB1_9PSEU|nr:hypothetical protein CFP71_39395 [Amycolatopsis thailandensis]